MRLFPLVLTVFMVPLACIDDVSEDKTDDVDTAESLEDTGTSEDTDSSVL